MDDNCDIYGKDKPITSSDETSSRTATDTDRTKVAEAEAMVDMIMKRMNEVFRPPQRLQRCKACGGDHPTNQCLSKQTTKLISLLEPTNGANLRGYGPITRSLIVTITLGT